MADNLFWQPSEVSTTERERAHGHRGAVIWFTGLSAAGKSTLAQALERCLFDAGCRTFLLDGDNVRQGLCADLGFSETDRHENIRRVGAAARLMADAGLIVLAAFISPYRTDRDALRASLGPARFVEVYCRCPLEVCERRDPKGLYRRARRGEISEFTGISAPYEAPLAPDLVLDTAHDPIGVCVQSLLQLLDARGIVARSGRHGAGASQAGRAHRL